jgi:hypothetical protein
MSPPFNVRLKICRMRLWGRKLAVLLLSGGMALSGTIGGADVLDRGSVEAEIRPMQALGLGFLVGQVSRGPLSPVEKAGESSTAPVAGLQVRIAHMDGKPVETVVSDPQGHYQLTLPVGAYRVIVPHPPSGLWVKDLPAEVRIESGQTTRLNIRLDTGVR